ncbi:MAG: hypothetical protein IJS43_01105, partial [Bacteroidaceae bacterium]|nr:hypothetical protein [Bacteroidaceae bacterium]
LSNISLKNAILEYDFSTNVLKTLTTIFSNVHELFCFAVPHDGESFYTNFHEFLPEQASRARAIMNFLKF